MKNLLFAILMLASVGYGQDGKWQYTRTPNGDLLGYRKLYETPDSTCILQSIPINPNNVRRQENIGKFGQCDDNPHQSLVVYQGSAVPLVPDTTQAWLLIPVTREYVVPVHHWEEAFYGAMTGAIEITTVELVLGYRIYDHRTWEYTCYTPEWKKVTPLLSFTGDYVKSIKPDTIRINSDR